jgi:hypothetical protein
MHSDRLAAVDADAIITLHDTTTGGVIGKFKPHAGGIAWPYFEGVKFFPGPAAGYGSVGPLG